MKNYGEKVIRLVLAGRYGKGDAEADAFIAAMDDARQKHGRRWCQKCKGPIRQHHKWLIGDDGRLEHRTCADPESYR